MEFRLANMTYDSSRASGVGILVADKSGCGRSVSVSVSVSRGESIDQVY